MEAFASAAVALRARTGSARLEVDSLEDRMAEMEEAKAEGSLRLDFWWEIFVWLGLEGWDCEESESVSELEEEADDWSSLVSSTGGGEAFEAASVSASSSESARLTAGNSSSAGDGEAEGLEWYSCFRDFLGLLP